MRHIKLPLRILAIVLAVVLLAAAAYVVYVFIDYHRIEDHQELAVVRGADPDALVRPGVTYTAMTYNLGFGAYAPDYDFFMDGGSQSWAASPESVRTLISGAGDLIAGRSPDFVCLQEVDLNSTRSYHIDQKAMLDGVLSGYDTVTAVNYDSPFLFFPFTQPHGKSLSSLGLYTRFPASDALRRSLPIATDFSKLLDLDRAYMKLRVPMSDGRSLVLYTIHMTAYSSDSSIRDAQLRMLTQDMLEEYGSGSAVICGGDYNMEMLLTESGENTAEWALPLDRSLLSGLINVWDAVTPEHAAAQQPSCRDAGVPYAPGQTASWMLDSFLVSPNIVVEDVVCLATGYSWSDHDPVLLTFHIQ